MKVTKHDTLFSQRRDKSALLPCFYLTRKLSVRSEKNARRNWVNERYQGFRNLVFFQLIFLSLSLYRLQNTENFRSLSFGTEQ
jgi:hypothetical protein